MIMDKFTETEQVEILELARIALSDAENFDGFAMAMDLSDDYMCKLLKKIEENTKGVELEY